MKKFSEYIMESYTFKVKKVIVKGFEKYLVELKKDGPGVLLPTGELRTGKDYFKELSEDEYFKSEKEANTAIKNFNDKKGE